MTCLSFGCKFYNVPHYGYLQIKNQKNLSKKLDSETPKTYKIVLNNYNEFQNLENYELFHKTKKGWVSIANEICHRPYSETSEFKYKSLKNIYEILRFKAKQNKEFDKVITKLHKVKNRQKIDFANFLKKLDVHCS